MDSRLLNVVYDDPFDGNYTKYDNDTEFWSSGSDTMGMQLTETLHGILPIAPTDDFRKDDSQAAITLQSNKNAFNYDEFTGQHITAGGAIEIVTVDPNADGFDTDSEDDDDVDEEDLGDSGVHNGLLEFDRQSQCSNMTFRTRTDSSSIGDYESHTSDYDDDDDDDDDDDYDEDDDEDIIAHNYLNGSMGNIQGPVVAVPQSLINPNKSILDIDAGLVGPDDILLDTRPFQKNRTMSTNTINSDVDGLGLNIDANNFDLAEFITKDDFTINPEPENITSIHNTNAASLLAANGSTTTQQSITQVISSKLADSDSDSDVIVDVETVEADDDDNVISLRKASELLKPQVTQIAHLEEEIPFVDNTTTDPSWCPERTAVKKAEVTKPEEKQAIVQKHNFTRNITLVPNKKQCDMLKGKFGKGKATTKPIVQKSTKMSKAKTSTENISPPQREIKVECVERKTGIGMGGKNLALLKHERISISEQSSEENITPLKCQVQVEPKTSAVSPKTSIHAIKNEDETPAQKAAQAVKRKLNLEEYKKRRGESPLGVTQAKAKLQSYKIPKLEDKLQASQIQNNEKNAQSPASAPNHSEEVKSVVKSLKEKQHQPQTPVVDPITEAKNKVLRMQELKKAQQMRIIDSTISAKVPKVTKLLPLREIVKDSPYLNEGKNANANYTLKCHPDYEEIIIVSASCNTDISIPPTHNPSIQPVNPATRSLLKSSALLSSISNTFQKVKANDNGKISTNSLIASIQDVVAKKTLPVENTNESTTTDQSKPEHHGEDKIIMHLRKDRIRKRTCTVSIQTDLQPEFPPLPLPKSAMQHKSRERVRKHRKRQYRKRKETSSPISSEYSSDELSDNSNSSSISRFRDNSSSSLERMRTYDSAIGTGGYSSRSSRKHRSSVSSSYSESVDRDARGRRQRRTSYKQRSSRKRSSGSPYSSSSYTSDSDRSRSPMYRRSRSRSNSQTSRLKNSNYRQNKNYVDRNVSQPAVEERRIVYVGRIEQETTKDILRRKFIQYGTIKQISIHYKDTGMKYGFVTFERSQDAFNAIDNSTRDPQINMYDVSFGGRRAFCRASYADLDNAGINTYQSFVFPQQQQQQPKEEDSFEALLLKMKAKLSANKNTNASSSSPSLATTATTTLSASTSTPSTTNSDVKSNGKI